MEFRAYAKPDPATDLPEWNQSICPAMSRRATPRLQLLLTAIAVLLIVKVTGEVVLGYRNYFPPQFDTDFLRGRERYFFGGYQFAFYVHLISGPLSLGLGLLLLSPRFRNRNLALHRKLGRLQAVNVLLLLTPSGIFMARHALFGVHAAVAFWVLSVLTAATIVLGWRAAVQRRFLDHQRWMMRNFVLLCSAITLRLLGGLATVLDVQSSRFDLVASWASWVVPLALLECVLVFRNGREVCHRRKLGSGGWN